MELKERERERQGSFEGPWPVPVSNAAQKAAAASITANGGPKTNGPSAMDM